MHNSCRAQITQSKRPEIFLGHRSRIQFHSGKFDTVLLERVYRYNGGNATVQWFELITVVLGRDGLAENTIGQHQLRSEVLDYLTPRGRRDNWNDFAELISHFDSMKRTEH